MQNNGRKSKKFNTYNLTGDYGVGYTAKGKEFYFDLDDYNKIKNYCWYLDQNGYILNKSSKNYVFMHRLIMDCEDSNLVVDHINGVEYDNRKNNLRIATQQQNCFNSKMLKNNTSGYKGVSFVNHCKKWRAYIEYDKKRYNLGLFKNIDDAIKARIDAEIKYFGEFRFKECDY